MSLDYRTGLDNSCLRISIANCPRPPVPGKEDDRMPCDCSDPCSQSNIFADCSSSVSGGGKTAGKVHETKACGLSERTAVGGGCSAVNRDTKPTLETSGYAAALSYEPDGSSAAPGCLKWAEGLDRLLEDSDGVRLFKEFLDQEQGSNSLDFWFACSGLKMINVSEPERIIGLVKLIFKKYIKGDVLNLRSEVKRRIVERMKKNQVDQKAFDEAQAEIEASMRQDLYPLFLKSDLYLQFVQTGQESPKQSNNSSSSEALYQCVGVGGLPTLHEDEELASKDLNSSSVSSILLTPSSLLATRKVREAFPSAQYYGCAYPRGSSSRLSNPYHVSYAPVSAQDSELQSLSSDALTDDTTSYTDSSVDGREHGGYKNKNMFRKQTKAMRRYAEANQETDLQFMQQFIPRTERVPLDSSLAETDPSRFAGRLIEKLLRVKEEQEKMEWVRTSLKSIQDTECDDQLTGLQMRSDLERSHSSSCGGPTHNFSFASMLLASTVGTSDPEDNAQSILDDHVSHVWNSSGATPIRSPGFQTPNCTRHDLVRLPPGPALLPATQKTKDYGGSLLANAVHGLSIHKDSSRFDGCPIQVSHKHRHHHHLPKEFHGWQHPVAEAEAPQYHHSQAPGRSSVPWSNAVEAGKFSGCWKNVDGSNRFGDVGAERVPHFIDQGTNDVPSKDAMKERVLLWMLDSEKYYGDGTKNRCSTDGSDKGSSNKRSSHKSANSGLKKNGHHKSNRSESLDRSRISANSAEFSTSCLSAAGHVLHPRLAVMQDGFLVPSTSLIPGRSSEESRVSHATEGRTPPTKSRGELQHVETLLPSPSSNIPSRNLSTNRSIPPPPGVCQSSSDDLSSCSQKSDSRFVIGKNAMKGSMTRVAYFFCDEPIPYRSTLPGASITLSQFKQLISKKGNFRYFFRKASNEFETGVVHEEVTCDSDILPLWEGKVVCKIERIQ